MKLVYLMTIISFFVLGCMYTFHGIFIMKFIHEKDNIQNDSMNNNVKKLSYSASGIAFIVFSIVLLLNLRSIM